jgi:Na+-driven multidrug efflux pump
MKIVSNDQSTILLESNNISKSIITISFPMMVTGFVDALYNIVDSIFVGRFVGEYALAALAVNSAIQIFLIAIGSLYGTGMTSIISRALGAKNDSKVKSTIVNGVFLCFISTFAISLLVLSNLDKVLTFMGSSEDVLSYSRQYGSIILWFGFLVPTNGVLHGILRARGAVKIVMKIMLK